MLARWNDDTCAGRMHLTVASWEAAGLGTEFTHTCMHDHRYLFEMHALILINNCIAEVKDPSPDSVFKHTLIPQVGSTHVVQNHTWHFPSPRSVASNPAVCVFLWLQQNMSSCMDQACGGT